MKQKIVIVWYIFFEIDFFRKFFGKILHISILMLNNVVT